MNLAHLIDIYGYHQLLGVIKAQKEARGISDKDLEHIAELTAGHWSKIVNGTKALGPISMGKCLRGVGLKLRPFIDEEAIAKTNDLYLPRTESQVRKKCQPTGAVQVTFTRSFMRRIGAKGGKNSRRNLGKRQRKKLAQRAAMARVLKTTSERRIAIAKLGAAARWARAKLNRPTQP